MKRVVLKRSVAYMRKDMVSGMSYEHETMDLMDMGCMHEVDDRG